MIPVLLFAALVAAAIQSHAQLPPTPQEAAQYEGLFAAAARGDAAAVPKLVAAGARVDARDGHGRTPLHVAAFERRHDAIALAVRSGAPIFAAEEVISESAIEFEHDVEESEDVVEKFKEFLDEVSPEDFAAGDS
jgi:ankyrin repeat protein